MRADTAKYKVLFRDNDGALSSASRGINRKIFWETFGRRYYVGRTARMPYGQKDYGLLIFDSLSNADYFLSSLWHIQRFTIFRVATGKKVWEPGVSRWWVDTKTHKIVPAFNWPWPVGTLMTNCLRLVEEVKS